MGEDERDRYETPPDNLSGEVRGEGMKAELLMQDEEFIGLRIYCSRFDREWYEYKGKIKKEKFKRIGSK
jgi:hypothetical protein